MLLETGDLVEVLLETEGEVSEGLKAFAGSLAVLYEDQDVIVVDKPSGLTVHPVGRTDGDTMRPEHTSFPLSDPISYPLRAPPEHIPFGVDGLRPIRYSV